MHDGTIIMITEQINIQLFLSRLINNPRCLIRALGSPDKYCDEIKVSTSCKEAFKDFSSQHGLPFLASALMQSRKRKLAIIDTLPCYQKLKTADELDQLWHRYLFSFALDDHTPKNPVYESIAFCQYVLRHETLTPLDMLLLRYELARNETIIAYNTWPHRYMNQAVSIEKLEPETLDQYQLFVHPCAKIVTFAGNISILIKAVQSSDTIPSLYTLLDDKTNESIIFYKNYNNAKVTSFKLTGNLITLIKSLQTQQNLKDIYVLCQQSFNLSVEAFIQIIQQLSKLGLGTVLVNHMEQ